MTKDELWKEIEFRAKELKVGGLMDVDASQLLNRVIVREFDLEARLERGIDGRWTMRFFAVELGGSFPVPQGCTDEEVLKMLESKEDPEFQKEMEDRILKAHEEWVRAASSLMKDEGGEHLDGLELLKMELLSNDACQAVTRRDVEER